MCLLHVGYCGTESAVLSIEECREVAVMTSAAEISEDVFPSVQLISSVSKDDMYVDIRLQCFHAA